MRKKYNIKSDCRGLFEEEIIETILNNRGIKDVEHFLNPIKDDLLPLDELENIQIAYNQIMYHLSENNPIGIYWDTDTDGVTSGTIMTRYLKNYSDNINTYINNGKVHGLINQDIERLKENKLLIIVDSLDKDESQYKRLSEYGVQIIVLDHHAIDSSIPYDKYITLVSSQRNYGNPSLSGAGVCWKMCKFIDYMELTDYADELMDLAAIGILADVMDVSEENYENRYIIKQGLNNLRNLAVKKILGGYEFNSKSVLFSIAPLINACTRCGNNEDVMNMFLSDDNKELLAYKKKLESYKEIQTTELEKLMPSIMKQIEVQKDESVVEIVIDTKYGIAGVIGNKILDEVNRPIIIISWENEDYIGGSIRSVGTDDFMGMVNSSEYATARGHENAAGIEIRKDKADEFLEYIRAEVDKLGLIKSEEIDIDAIIDAKDITGLLSRKIHDINFVSGNGFKPLTFKVVGFDDYSVGSWSKGKHLVLTYSNEVLTFIEWNTKADFNEMDDHSLIGDEIIGYGEIEGGFVGRKFIIKLIMNDFEVVE